MSRAIVVSGNCQIVGIAQTLQILFPQDSVHVYPLHVETPQRAELDEALRNADVWVAVTHHDNAELEQRVDTRAEQLVVPSLVFEGFHPDLVYAIHDDHTIFRGISDYHSAIGLWAWRRGMEPADAASLFTPEVFHELGYYDTYASATTLLRRSFEELGFDFTQFWRRIKRTGVFMHTINHPCIRTIVLLAKQIAVELGASPEVIDDPLERYVEDTLTSSIVWPVYSPIARHLGVAGSYRFRIEGAFYPTLPSFLEAQWAAYGSTDATRVRSVRDDASYDQILTA